MKKTLMYLLCCVAIVGLCSCKQNKDVVKEKEEIKVTENKGETTPKDDILNDEDIKKQDDKKDDATIEENPTIEQEDNDQNDDINNDENIIDIPKEEQNIPSDNNVDKKIVVCTMNEESNYYYGTVSHTTIFENGTIVHDKMYIEKHFKEGYKAEEDNWTISNIEALENNTKIGITGEVYVKNNVTYLTINYDVKANPKNIEYITTHTKYNDFLNHMTTKNGYSCIIK